VFPKSAKETFKKIYHPALFWRKKYISKGRGGRGRTYHGGASSNVY